MRLIHALLAVASLSIIAVGRTLLSVAVSFARSFIPMLVDPRTVLMLGNGHPRSPLASIRAGVA